MDAAGGTAMSHSIPQIDPKGGGEQIRRLREALEGVCNLLLVVWDLKGWVPDDYQEYKAARAALMETEA
jgi:hypothetical protein